MRGYAIAPFAKRKGREQAKRAGVCPGRGREVARSRRQLPSRPPHSNANSKSSAKRQRPSFRRKPALQRTERPSRGEGQRETPANWPRIHHTRGHANRPFRKAKGARASEAMRAGYARGGAGRSLAAVDSFPHPLRTRTPIRNHRRSHQPTVIPVKASASADGTSI